MPAESLLQANLNNYTPGYVLLADTNKNVFMEIPYSNLRDIHCAHEYEDTVIGDDPLHFAYYAPTYKRIDWTIRCSKSAGPHDALYTIIDRQLDDADPGKLEALLNECV